MNPEDINVGDWIKVTEKSLECYGQFARVRKLRFTTNRVTQITVQFITNKYNTYYCRTVEGIKFKGFLLYGDEVKLIDPPDKPANLDSKKPTPCEITINLNITVKIEETAHASKPKKQKLRVGDWVKLPISSVYADYGPAKLVEINDIRNCVFPYTVRTGNNQLVGYHEKELTKI